VPSYNELRREAQGVDRWNRLHPSEKPRTPYIVQQVVWENGPIIAASDYIKAQPDQLAPWLGSRLHSLGTDGFGRSDNREHLRNFFEISAEAIVQATLSALAGTGAIPTQRAELAVAEMGFHP
jgi:pyruvate dehydrogenase E1 component